MRAVRLCKLKTKCIPVPLVTLLSEVREGSVLLTAWWDCEDEMTSCETALEVVRRYINSSTVVLGEFIQAKTLE